MPAPSSTNELLEIIHKSAVVSREKLATGVLDPANLPADPSEAATALVDRGVITRFQATLMMQGRHKGFRLGSHVVLGMLGRGGMGIVYLAEHEDLRRKVAVKVLLAGKDTDAKLAQERFLREARAAAALDHPNIVRIFDVARQGDAPYLVMEYVDGENLQTKIDRDGPMPHTDAVECIAQTAAGLQHAFEKGFVHRDIKPANLMWDSSGTIKILDMGLARAFDKTEDNLTEMMDKGAIVGTADYISPEQALNNPVDIRADIYSLGATFYALMTGRPPFDGNTTQKLLQHQLKAPPTLTSAGSKVPPDLAEVIGKMLAKKPSARYQTPADVITALACWLPSSHRVLAGLSRTRLGANTDIQAAIQEVARSSTSLKSSSVTVEIEEEELDEGKKSTSDTVDGIQGNRTSRTRQSKVHRKPMTTSIKKGAGRKKNKKTPYLVLGGVAAVLIGAAGAYLLSGGTKTPPSVAVNTTVDEQKLTPRVPVPTPAPAKSTPTKTVVAPKSTSAPTVKPPAKTAAVPPAKTAPVKPKPAPTVPVSVPVPAPTSLYRFDATKIPTFRFAMLGFDQAKGNLPILPPGVSLGNTLAKTESIFAGEPVNGSPAITLVNGDAGSASAGLFLDLERALPPGTPLTPGRTYRVDVEYRADGANRLYAGAQTLSGKPIQPPVSFAATKDGFSQGRLEFRAGVDHLRIAIENKSVGLANAIAIRSVEFSALPPPAPNAAPPALLEMDLKDMKPFTQLAEVAVNTKDRSRTSRLVSKTGEGKMPTGWTGRAVGLGSQIEYLYDGSKEALGLRNVSGPGGALLVSPPFTAATSVCAVQFEYQSTAIADKAHVKFRGVEGNAREVASLNPTSGSWAKFAGVLDMNGTSSGNLEFSNDDPRPTGTVLIRGLKVTELPASAAKPRVLGTNLFSLDLSDTPKFANKKDGIKRLQGDQERLPKGVRAITAVPLGVANFRCEVVDGKPALYMSNANEAAAAMYSFDFETTMGLKLEPNKEYRVKIEYQTNKDASGNVFVVGSNSAVVTARRLTSATPQWATAEVNFIREPDVPVRMVITNRGPAGELNSVLVRSVELFELK